MTCQTKFRADPDNGPITTAGRVLFAMRHFRVTVCTVSQVENVDCMEDNHIKFDFLGKDSIRYENEVQVNQRVYELVQEFCRKDAQGKRESPIPPSPVPVLS